MIKSFDLITIKSEIHSDHFRDVFSALYGDNNQTLSYQSERYLRLAGLFTKQYPGIGSFRIFSAPGRIEIAGNHTDHQGGAVVCASVDLDVIAFAAHNDENIIRVKSEGHSSYDVIDLSVIEPQESEKGSSAALIRGVAAGLHERGFKVGGFDAYTTSNILKGSGLSSSAAFEILIATILNSMYNNSCIPPLTLAEVSQFAENKYFGKPSGLMDQCGCSFGGIMTIDFKDKENAKVTPLSVDFSESGYLPVITDTKGDHSDLTGEYAAITEDMKKVASFFGEEILSRVDPVVFYRKLADVSKATGAGAALRAMHFFADNERVPQQAAALSSGDFAKFLTLISESGISSWTLLRNIFPASHPERQQVALGLAASSEYLRGMGACRVHGGGFAGTIQAFVPKDMLDGYVRKMEELFGQGSCSVVQIRNIPASEPFA